MKFTHAIPGQPLRAITLYQPYASLMAMGRKTIETRSWFMRYRGDIAICSSSVTRARDLREAMAVESIARAVVAGADAGILKKDGEFTILPYGVVLAVVEVYDIKPVWQITDNQLNATEPDFGDYSTGRWGWITRNLRRLETPVPVRGHQGIWFLPEDVWHFVEAQIKPKEPIPTT